MSQGDYEVGYGKPPKHNRFKAGQSGNPKGRPKGTKNLATDLAEELGEKLLVTENGKQQRITKQRAMVKAVVAKALKGDVRAIDLLLKKISDVEQTQSADVDRERLSREDQAILDTFRRQLIEELRPPIGGNTQ
jgi:hypothetical protein